MKRIVAAAAASLVALGLMAAPSMAGTTFDFDKLFDSKQSSNASNEPNSAPGELQAEDFYVDPNSNPKMWVEENPDDPRAATIDQEIASKPMAHWFGDWNTDISADVDSYVGAADAEGKLPVLVAYNVPGRDCGGHSNGGAGSPEAYRTWISEFAGAIGDRDAVVIVEPDSLAQLDCMPNDAERQVRTELISYAGEQLAAQAPNAMVYLDAGNATWIEAPEMASRLEAAGVANVRGFAVNVSNYITTEDSGAYGQEIQSNLSTDSQFVIDTSRNGNGANEEWCNPPGRKLGTPSQHGSDVGAEMQIWVKVPGDSDGDCGIGAGIPAGTFSPDLAMALIEG